MVNLVGTLLNPFGEPLVGAVIRFESTANEHCLIGVIGSKTTDNSGGYDFNLIDGDYLLDINHTSEFKISGKVRIDSTLPEALTLVQLVEDYSIAEGP